jgi:predicted nucleic acid-binding protein
MPFLVDSNVLIDVSRGKTAAIKYVDGLPEPWVLSQVTAMELIVGARDKWDLVTIDNFLSLYPVVPLSERIGARAYQLLKSYAKSHGLHVFDSLIAATAMENALTLITLNRKHYEMIEGLWLKVPNY